MIHAIKALRKEVRRYNIKAYYSSEIVKTQYGAYKVDVHRDLNGKYQVTAIGITDYVLQLTPDFQQELFLPNEKLSSVMNKIVKKLTSYSDWHCRRQKELVRKLKRIPRTTKNNTVLKHLFPDSYQTG